MTFELEYREWYANGRKVQCRICKSRNLALVGRGSVWVNFLCEEDHLTTIRGEVSRVPQFTWLKEKVPIIEHRITIVEEKEVVLYLPEDVEVDDFVWEYQDKFDHYDSFETSHDTTRTEMEYDEDTIFDKDYNLNENFNPLTGHIECKEERKESKYKQMKVIG